MSDITISVVQPPSTTINVGIDETLVVGAGISFPTHSVTHISGGSDELNHNLLGGLQGGFVNQRYHISSGQYFNLTTGDVVRPSETGQFYSSNNPSGYITEINDLLYTTGDQIKSGRLIIGNDQNSIVDPNSPYTLSIQTNNTDTWLEILNNSGTNKGVFFGIQDNNFEQYNWQGGDIKFFTSENPSDGIERLIIKNDGKIGIGINSPSEILEVIGNIKSNTAIFDNRPTVNGTGVLLSGEAYSINNPSGYITGVDLSFSGNYYTKNESESRYVNTTGAETILGNKTFHDSVYINNLYVTGLETIVNTTNANVASNYIMLNLTGGAVDGGIFFVTGSGLTGINDSGAIIGFDHSDKFKFGIGTRGSDLSILSTIASEQQVTGVSGYLQTQVSILNNQTGNYTLKTETGNFITINETGQFYSNTNPSGFIVSVPVDYRGEYNNGDGTYTYDSVVLWNNLLYKKISNPGNPGYPPSGPDWELFEPQIGSPAYDLWVQTTLNNKVENSQTGQFYPTTNPSGYITGIDLSSYVLDSETGNFITINETGQFYPFSNPNEYASTGYVTGISGDLQSQITTLDNQTSSFYPRSNPSGYITGVFNTVFTIGDQRIDGTKNFTTRPTVNSIGVLLRSETGIFLIDSDLSSVVFTTGNQNIGGDKTFTTGLTVRSTTNQLELRTGSAGNSIFITAPTINGNRIYTLPDVNAAASFVLTAGSQTINGVKNFNVRPTVDTTGVALVSEVVYITGDQKVGGIKTFGENTNIYNSVHSHILGGEINTISGVTGSGLNIGNITSYTGCFIGGGNQNNIVSANYSIIGGGQNNHISGVTGTGALGNLFIDRVVYSTIAGGLRNDVYKNYGTIVGGQDNAISGNHSFIGGGRFNSGFGDYSTIGGGDKNQAYGDNSTIGGGQSNTASSNFSTIGGGVGNFAFGTHSTIGGGLTNSAYAIYSTVGGGFSNRASGSYSIIAGGRENSIQSNAEYSSILGGRRVSITSAHVGATVLADGQDRTHSSKGAQTCSLDFANGVFLRLPTFAGAKGQAGNLGELKVSGEYLYIATGANTWGRIQISTF